MTIDLNSETPVGLRYKQRSASLDTYILAPQGVVQSVLMDRWPLVAEFARGDEDAAQVLLDALLEVCTPYKKFAAARQEAERKGMSIFWFGLVDRGHIRQRVRKRDGLTSHGWREVTDTARVHRAMRKRAVPQVRDSGGEQ